MDEREREELELKLSMYLDGELPDQERDQLEARLRDDPEARAFLAEQLQVHAALGTLGAERRRAQRLRRRMLLLLWFAVAFLVILGLLILFVLAFAR